MANLANVCFSFESFVFMKHLERARFCFSQRSFLHSIMIFSSVKDHCFGQRSLFLAGISFELSSFPQPAQGHHMQIRTPTSLFPERGCKLFVAPPCSVLVVLIDYFEGGVSRKPLSNIWHYGCVCLFVWLQSG